MGQAKTQQLSKIYRGTIDEVFSIGENNLAATLLEIGTVDGLPADLSTNPKYMQGFGC